MSEATETKILAMMENITVEINAIKVAIAEQVATLRAHTESDASNFTSMNSSMSNLHSEISKVREDLHKIQLERAHEAGAREAALRAGKLSGARWGAGVGAALAALFETLRWFFTSNPSQ